MLVATALVLLMTPRARLLLRRAGALQEFAQHDDDELRRPRRRRRGLGAARLQPGVRGGECLDRRHGYALLAGVGTEAKGTIPHVLFMAYQGTFAIITAALISGAMVERMRFGPYLAFIALWSLLVYAPVAHWVWGGGWLMSRGVLDFAGGTVVHINAGVSALVAALVLGVRKDYGRQAILPHNVPFVLLGAGLLWFGWFGFNGGSALGANELPRSPSPTRSSRRWPRWSSGCCSTTSAPGTPRRSAAPRPSSSAWSPSRPRPATSARSSALAARRPRRVPELFRHRRAVAHAAGRFAGRVRRPRHRRHHRRAAHRRLRLQGLEPRRRRRSAGRQPGPAGHPGARGRQLDRLFGASPRTSFSSCMSLVTRAPRRAPRRGAGHGRHPARRGGVHQRRGLDPRHPRRAPVGAPAPALTPQAGRADAGRTPT